MKVLRFFAKKGNSVLYVDQEKKDKLPENIREAFKDVTCGQGDIAMFPGKVKAPLEEHGYFVYE